MQFLPLPLVTLVRPPVFSYSLPQSITFFILVISLALASDFKKYTLAYVLNNLASS